MSAFDHNALDDVIHGRVRLGIMAYLSTAETTDFVSLRDALDLSDGNLSTHVARLEEAGYVRTKKSFAGKKPLTTVVLTDAGRRAYASYLVNLKRLLQQG